MQDAWEKLVRRGMTLPGGDALEAHVHEALVDVSGDHRRARRRKKVVPPEKIVPLEALSDRELGLEHSEDGNLAALAVRELYETTVALVGESTVAYAVLDALGFSEKEIATKLEVTEAEAGALRKRVARSRAAIAEAINGRLEATKEDH